MSVLLGAIELPGDLRWADEFAWGPVASQVEVACNGALWVEESAQLAGRPITLESGTDAYGHWAVVSRQTVEALWTLASAPLAAPLVLVLEDGRTFNVRFRHGDGAALEATPIVHIAPHVAGDLYHITIRLLQV
ncbi:hypothetical protein CO641_02435 [Lysobacteraceae bacterium NML91-0213]|nr:hypothetical protein CO641_02435 [Xanthomonadaceae bacterium NML91-0213]